ncbi:ribonuclease T2 [Sporobolomyces koalae]|uniref:ribonuclease T2 n=1 Tax=Sporobolomyces koalae TaxID=500713 RepID=UPI0031747911
MVLLPLELAYPLAATLLLSSTTPVLATPGPNLSDVLSKLSSSISSKAHKFVGLNACPAPAFLPSSCVNGHSPQNVDGCCTNVPGGYLLQTQFWDASPPTGPNNSWTIHGLWPDNCDGTHQQYCDPSREYTDIRGKLQQYGPKDLVPYMDVYWKDYQGNDESFWEHEWDKHGTCISTLNTTCYGSTYTPYEELVGYFERTVSTFKSLPTFEWLAEAGIVPSSTKTYSLTELQSVAKSKFGNEVVWNCEKGGVLNEVWYGYNSKGPIAGGKLVPTGPIGSGSTCPSTGIKYLPKLATNSSSSSGGTGTGGSSSGGSGSSGSSSFLKVLVDGEQNGCLISNGKWYTTGTCAGYRTSTVSTDSNTFTLSTSKGPCTVLADSGTLSCAAGNSASTFSKDSNNYLTYDSKSEFYASQVASGSNQIPISTESGTIQLEILFEEA